MPAMLKMFEKLPTLLATALLVTGASIIGGIMIGGIASTAIETVEEIEIKKIEEVEAYYIETSGEYLCFTQDGEQIMIPKKSCVIVSDTDNVCIKKTTKEYPTAMWILQWPFGNTKISYEIVLPN